MADPTPEQVEIESLRNHNSELLAELKSARATAKQLTAQVETLTIDLDQAVTTLHDETVARPARALVERVSPMPDHFETEFKKRGYQFVHTAGGIRIHDAEGKLAQVQDSAASAPRDCALTAADLSSLVLEGWKPEAERHPSVLAFKHLVLAAPASGGGSRDSGPGERGPSPAASTRATSAAPPSFGIR